MIESQAMGRRRFLGWAATGAAGLLLPTMARPRAKVFDMGRGLFRQGPPHWACVTSEFLGNCMESWRVDYGYQRSDGSVLWLPADGLAAERYKPQILAPAAGTATAPLSATLVTGSRGSGRLFTQYRMRIG